MTAKITRSQAGDAKVLTEIAKTAKACWGYPKEWLDKWDAALTITRQDIAQNWVFHLEQEEKIVGVYVLSQQKDNIWKLDHMWVLPEHMGKGYGRQLFLHAKETAIQEGGTKLLVTADPNAEGFYQKMGLRRVGEKASSIPGRFLPKLEMDL